MIDNGEGNTWQDAMQADNRSLKFCTTAELNAPFVLEAIQRWYGCTMDEAIAARAAELQQRA